MDTELAGVNPLIGMSRVSFSRCIAYTQLCSGSICIVVERRYDYEPMKRLDRHIKVPSRVYAVSPSAPGLFLRISIVK